MEAYTIIYVYSCESGCDKPANNKFVTYITDTFLYDGMPVYETVSYGESVMDVEERFRIKNPHTMILFISFVGANNKIETVRFYEL